MARMRRRFADRNAGQGITNPNLRPQSRSRQQSPDIPQFEPFYGGRSRLDEQSAATEERQMAELIMQGNPELTKKGWFGGIKPTAGAKGLDSIFGLYNNRFYGKNFRGTVGSIPGNIAEGAGSEGLTIEDIIQTVPAGWQENFRDVQGIGGFQTPQDVYDQMLYMQQQGNFVV